MSEPSRPLPVPGPPAGSAPRSGPAGPLGRVPGADDLAGAGSAARFADLDARPVDEHVDVFEAEHGRLERELRTIDQL